MIDHDQLFKQLISTFFVEFLELFFPEVVAYMDTSSIEFLDKELFTDIIEGEEYEADLVVKARFRESGAFFLIHNENQETGRDGLGKGCFCIFHFCTGNTGCRSIRLRCCRLTRHERYSRKCTKSPSLI